MDQSIESIAKNLKRFDRLNVNGIGFRDVVGVFRSKNFLKVKVNSTNDVYIEFDNIESDILETTVSGYAHLSDGSTEPIEIEEMEARYETP